MRGWHACWEAGREIVQIIGYDTHIDDALGEVTARGLYRIAIRQLIGRDLGGGTAVRLHCRRNRFNLRRAIRAITFGRLRDSAGLQRKTDPHGNEQAEYSGPGAP